MTVVVQNGAVVVLHPEDEVTQGEACRLLGITRRHMRRLPIPHRREGRRVLYSESALRRWRRWRDAR
ncbi:MAG: hypothetical protein U0167_15445 [bacterium]